MRFALGLSLFALVGCSESSSHAPSPPTDASVDETQADTALGDTNTPPPVDVGTVVTPGDPGASDVKLTIRADMGHRPISPLIYGTNGTEDIANTRQTIVRSGGNRLTAYNWENNGSNAGSDYCFQNDRFFVPPSGPNTPGYAVSPMMEQSKASNAAAIITVPIVDYVAADTNDNGDGGAGPPSCVGDVRKSGTNYLSTRFKQNKPAKGAAFATAPDVSDAFVYQDEFVNWVKTTYGARRVVFSLDNEPDLWADTHAEIHPMKVTYDELVKRNTDYAKAIKAAWPEAQTLGFVSYGYAGYTTLQDAPDRGGKGEFTDYYLKKMKEAGDASGKRLIDYLDLHWYSEARGDGIRVTERADGTGAAARVQAPRSLWDESYKENSWIANDVLGGPIKLLPRYLEKIATNYPGTGLAITEWNYGGGGHISGAIATADALGVFGREGVGVATLWYLHSNETFTRAGLRVFTNYDGAGARFGNTSISATSSDAATASVYAALDGAARATVVVINKATTAKTAGITFAHSTVFKTAKVYVLQGTTPNLAPATALTPVATNAFNYSMPPMSVSVLVPE